VKILVAGDTHANERNIKRLMDTAARCGCQAVIQVGDFGYWPHETGGRWFLRNAEKMAWQKKIPLFWIDGNHENHAMIDRYLRDSPSSDRLVGIPTAQLTPKIPGRGKSGQASSPDVPKRTEDWLRYLPRGYRWEWEGVHLLALGGAWSVDREFRQPGRSWWPGETINDEDVVRACEGGRVDVMVTHDAPGEYSIPGDYATGKITSQTMMNRSKVASVVNSVRPKVLIHGHYHVRYEQLWPMAPPRTTAWSCRIIGLASDIQHNLGEQAVVLHLPEIAVSMAPADAETHGRK
jgi:hypothetical protein